MPDEIEKNFVKSFISFLKQQCGDKKLNADQQESVEVAIQCLEAAYDVENPESEAPAASTTENVALQKVNLFEVYQTMCLDNKPENKELAEEIKNEGNRLMKENKYFEALQQYNKAIVHDPRNPVLYCNRAAAYTRLGESDKAVSDCKLALVYNPNYGKAYGRMGIAYSNMNKFDLAKTAYQRAIELEPENQDYANNLMVAEQRISQSSATNTGAAPGAGGAGGLGGFNNVLLETLNNPEIGNFLRGMMQDPMISTTLQNFAQDPSAVLNMSRQLADQLNNANPELLNQLRNVAGGMGNLPFMMNPQAGNNQGNNPGPDQGGNQQDPPSGTS